MDMRSFIGRSAGVDINNEVVRLGEFDSSGHIVGFIDEKGNCWQSVQEHDCALSAGRFADMMALYRRGEGEMPDARAVAEAICIDEGNIEAAIREIEEDQIFTRKARSAMRRQEMAEILRSFPEESRSALIRFITLLAQERLEESGEGHGAEEGGEESGAEEGG